MLGYHLFYVTRKHISQYDYFESSSGSFVVIRGIVNEIYSATDYQKEIDQK